MLRLCLWTLAPWNWINWLILSHPDIDSTKLICSRKINEHCFFHRFLFANRSFLYKKEKRLSKQNRFEKIFKFRVFWKIFRKNTNIFWADPLRKTYFNWLIYAEPEYVFIFALFPVLRTNSTFEKWKLLLTPDKTFYCEGDLAAKLQHLRSPKSLKSCSKWRFWTSLTQDPLRKT